MSAFDSVAEFAVTEAEADTNVIILAPTPTDLALAFLTPTISAGKAILPGATDVALAFPAPTVSAGVNIVVPNAIDIAIGVAQQPAISSGTAILATATSMALAFPAPTVSAGVNIVLPAPPEIDALRTSGSVAEFAVTEDGTDYLGLILLSFPIPTISAGFNILLPAPVNIAIGLPAPELVARGRAARVQLLTA